ncbi:MAG: hypothetical protein KDJ75_10395, partial [Alphaproteobacteria bacterium]|nr:hypothetical protein [Alphaproteobacteria bacterium]
WRAVRHTQAQWTNVPPVPSVAAASMITLGDSQFAYRVIGLMLQNFGDSGGRHTPLKDYDYERLGAWFMLQEALDPRSNFTPLLAVFFGASQDPTLIRPVIKYLEVAGNKTEGEKWRWLAHATYLARYKLKDMDLGYEIAVKLANLPDKDMPIWTRQMPAYVLNSRGDKEAALEIMLEILKSGLGKLDPTEVNTTVDYICTQILEEKEALNYPLCQQPSAPAHERHQADE